MWEDGLLRGGKDEVMREGWIHGWIDEEKGDSCCRYGKWWTSGGSGGGSQERAGEGVRQERGRLDGEIDRWMGGSGEEWRENASVAPLDS